MNQMHIHIQLMLISYAGAQTAQVGGAYLAILPLDGAVDASHPMAPLLQERVQKVQHLCHLAEDQHLPPAPAALSSCCKFYI